MAVLVPVGSLAQADGADIVRRIGDRLEIEFGDGEFLIGERQ
jgi:hypothetical protein